MRFLCSITLLIAFIISGCSGNPIHVDLEQNSTSNGSVAENCQNIEIFGIYQLLIDSENLTAELLPVRTSSLGESFLVEGKSYFTMSPCTDCLKISGIQFDSDKISLKLTIRHPFPKGDPLKPPSGKNRLDLDVFDPALVILPKNKTATQYSLIGSSIYDSVCIKPDGYTRELENLVTTKAALPYFLAVNDSLTGISTWNKLAMGESNNFTADFAYDNDILYFDLFLTMGYGSSAKRRDRLNPKYFNPEFNRKSAWKVVAIPPEGNDPPSSTNTWSDNDSTTPYNVKVEVYDWQIGENVNPELLNPRDIYANSDVASVSVEIPGMRNVLTTVPGNSNIGGTGKPNDPLVFSIPIANENLLPAGKYVSLVKVTDTRIPGLIPPSGDRDFLIHSPNGTDRVNYAIPECVTYQTFTATVIKHCTCGACEFIYHSLSDDDNDIYWGPTDKSSLPAEICEENDKEDSSGDVSSDGKKFYFNSNRSGNYEVYSIELDPLDCDPLNITHDPVDQTSVAVSPDNQWIITIEAGTMYKLLADGSMDRSDWIKIGDGASPDWSPDGLYVIYVWGGNIYKIDSGGLYPSQLLIDKPSISKSAPKYHPTGNYIIYYAADYNLYYWDFTDPAGNPHLYIDVAADVATGSFSPDGNCVIFQMGNFGAKEGDIYWALFPDPTDFIANPSNYQLTTDPKMDSNPNWIP